MAKVQMAWQDHGGNGPAVLLVHGFLCSAAQWLLNIPAMRAYCRPVTVELWGHGHSPSPAEPAYYHPDHWVEQFDAIRTALGVPHWLLVGYSLGAGATIRYALTYSERTLGHAFTNSASAFAKTTARQAAEGKAAANATKILEGGEAAIARIPVHPRHAKRLPVAVYEALMQDAAQLSPLGVANIMRYSAPRLSMRDSVHANSVPALLLCGQREKRFQAHRDFAEANMPNLQIADLDTGHGVNMEGAEAFNAALGAFVEQCTSTS